MIPASPDSAQPTSWKQALRDAFRDPSALLDYLELSSAQVNLDADNPFATLVPRSYAARMRKHDPADPLLLQVLPRRAERTVVAGYSLDAVGDLDSRRGAGLIHKYRGRVLLIATGSCPVHCRYCFRRHFPYAEETASLAGWQSALERIHADPSIHEVILSGGDPLSLATSKLAALTAELSRLPHLRRLRIHTRWPVMLPERVDEELLDWLGSLPWPSVIVLHSNHANELDDGVAAACGRMASRGVRLLNQAVLLRGVNDNLPAQIELSEALQRAGVLPYYLHLLDKVSGAAHFAVSERRGRELVGAMREQLPGYLVPRLAREVAGAASKSVLL